MSGYVVFRPRPDLPKGFMPEHWDGRWMNVQDVDPLGDESVKLGEHGRVCPTGCFETRESDGARAEVWEVRDERQVTEGAQ